MSSIGFTQKTKVYLFHGQGSDYRIFSELKIDMTKFDTIFINYPKITRRITMNAYAEQIVEQIDTTESVVLIGVSFGGMVISELNKLFKPRHSIIISSAQNVNEIPRRYRFMKYFPIHKLIPAFMYKIGAKIAQPIVEPDRKNNKLIFKAMLKDKDAKFIKGVTKLMIGWVSDSYQKNIIHIHGTNDHTLPLKNSVVDYKVPNGSHMMMLTRSSEINKIINSILSQQ